MRNNLICSQISLTGYVERTILLVIKRKMEVMK